jgi:hypothetical protein
MQLISFDEKVLWTITNQRWVKAFTPKSREIMKEQVSNQKQQTFR